MKKKFILFSFFLICFLPACESAREGFTLKKKDNSDEFLFEKKSPLVLPPVYGKFQTPANAIKKDENDEEFKEVISTVKKDSNNNISSVKSSTLEESILDKIK